MHKPQNAAGRPLGGAAAQLKNFFIRLFQHFRLARF
jgi:hypothetical protein